MESHQRRLWRKNLAHAEVYHRRARALRYRPVLSAEYAVAHRRHHAHESGGRHDRSVVWSSMAQSALRTRSVAVLGAHGASSGGGGRLIALSNRHEAMARSCVSVRTFHSIHAWTYSLLSRRRHTRRNLYRTFGSRRIFCVGCGEVSYERNRRYSR